MIFAILKAIHLFAAFAWMAGLWYYPRLLIYQREAYDKAQNSSEMSFLPKMARRLMVAILMPSMTFTLVFGLWLAVQGGYFSEGWMHIKLLLVSVLVVFSGYLAHLGKIMRNGVYPLTSRQLRLLNEVPTVILIAILYAVVVYRIM